MFEGKPPIALHALPGAMGQYADEELVAFSWGDLIARLGAVQDLRVALAKVPDTARASFDSLTAQRLANRPVFSLDQSKPGVNLAPSGNVKGADAKDGSSAASAQSDFRGIA